ncbi:DUF3152 domain-containing protein [Streptomyces sp. NPDC049590]|uniref:DUF3152 domain-containing protein n=1 Tax=Streptomyces sp. NPDC049590 TaxID=3154834 RepID=UPI0034415C30
MGRHSRRGPAPRTESTDITPERERAGRHGSRADGRQRPLPGPPAGDAPGPGATGLPDGTPAAGTPRARTGHPAHGTAGDPGGSGDSGAASARGGHPEQREAGGGWGELGGPATAGGPGVVLPRQRQAGSAAARRGSGRGPRQEYLEAFDGAGEADGPRGAGRGDTGGPGTGTGSGAALPGAGGPAEPQRASRTGAPVQRGGKGRTFTGIAAAAVTTVLAVMVAGQVTKARDDGDVRSRSATGPAHDTHVSGDSAPSAVPSAAALTYDQKMNRTYPLAATLSGPGKFDVVPGFAKAPGTGRKYRYRVDVEQGLGLDGALFAEAVQKTLNDRRSWAYGGARTFERVSSGTPDFVITLASPGTTAKWCAKSGLDTTEDNVSCDSAATERVMINAYRWARGSTTYGDRIHAYRQMLINHEVGHRLGHGHVTCEKDGELAPVMQQQTKFLDHDGIHCRANPWPYPGS